MTDGLCLWCQAVDAAAQVCERDVNWPEFACQPDINWKGLDQNYPWSQCSQPCTETADWGEMAVERHCADGGLKLYLSGIATARVIAATIRQELQVKCPYGCRRAAGEPKQREGAAAPASAGNSSEQSKQ